MHQMDIVTAYLYGHLDTVIHMEAPPELIQRVDYHCKGEQRNEAINRPAEGTFSYTNKDVLHTTSQAIALRASTKLETDNKALPARTRYRVQVLRSMSVS